jgi:cobalamin biosynthesis protein CobT
MACTGNVAAALDRAGVSVEGGGFHETRRGAGLGAAIAAAERAWIEAGFPMEQHALEAIADAAAKSAARS